MILHMKQRHMQHDMTCLISLHGKTTMSAQCLPSISDVITKRPESCDLWRQQLCDCDGKMILLKTSCKPSKIRQCCFIKCNLPGLFLINHVN